MAEVLERIHVGTLGNFVFCRRADVNAFKKQVDVEEQEEPRIPNLGYLPIFDENRLRERFEEIRPGLKVSWLVTSCGLCFLFLIFRYLSHSLALLLAPAFFPAAYLALRDTRILIGILANLSHYKREAPTPLNSEEAGNQAVTWWGLVKAGYRPIKPKESYVDYDLQLGGLPWRILSNDDGHRIAVIKRMGKKFEIRDSHIVRLAAYSHLIRKSEKASSDWGIVIDGKTLKGVAVRLGHYDRNKAIANLADLRRTLTNHSNKLPIATPNEKACGSCPFGYPQTLDKEVRESDYALKKEKANTSVNRAGKLVHSECGDEFRWTPPHKYWEQRGQTYR